MLLEISIDLLRQETFIMLVYFNSILSSWEKLSKEY